MKLQPLQPQPAPSDSTNEAGEIAGGHFLRKRKSRINYSQDIDLTLYPNLDIEFEMKKSNRKKRRYRYSRLAKGYEHLRKHEDSQDDCYYDSNLTPFYHEKLPNSRKELLKLLKMVHQR